MFDKEIQAAAKRIDEAAARYKMHAEQISAAARAAGLGDEARIAAVLRFDNYTQAREVLTIQNVSALPEKDVVAVLNNRGLTKAQVVAQLRQRAVTLPDAAQAAAIYARRNGGLH
jgi:hypothetical protein